MYDQIGVHQVIMIMQTETVPHERVMRSIEMFGKYVFPTFRRAAKGTAATAVTEEGHQTCLGPMVI